jgi:autotransporter translocation and assembly factor TamB
MADPRDVPLMRAPSPARRALRIVLTVVVAPLLLGVVTLLALANTPWGNERVRRIVVSQANGRINGELAIGRLRGGLLSNATLSDVTLLDSTKKPLFSAKRVRIRYALWPALRGRVVIESLALDTTLIVLDKRPGARWNFQSFVRPSTAPRDTSRHGAPPEIANVTITRGHLVYRRPWRPDTTLSLAKRDSAILAALRPTARSRTERVTGGYQRVLDYRGIDASIPVVRLAQGKQPMEVRIAALRMLAEPYRPPAIDVRSLVATLYASKDSLWWRNARMSLPASQVAGDGTIGFGKSGLRLDLSGAPVALADLRWLDPELPEQGGGRLRYTMRVHGDTSEFAISDADVRYRDASIVGNASVAQVRTTGRKSALIVRGADLTVGRLTTAVLRELVPSLPVNRSGTIDGRVVLSGVPSAMQVNANVRFDDATAGRSHLTARGGLGLTDGARARGLAVTLRPLRIATLGGSGIRLPIGGLVTGDATVNGSSREGWSVRGDLAHAEGTERSRIVGSGRYQVADKRIVADATLQPLSLITVGRFAPSAELRGSVAGRVHAEGTTRQLRLVGDLRSTNGGGALSLRGTLAPDGTRTRYDVAVALDALDASAFSRRAPSTRLTGTVSARGRGFAPATADAVVAASLVGSRVDTFTVDRLTTRVAATDGLLRVDTLTLLANGARADAGGTIGLVRSREGTLQASLSVDSLGALRRWLGSTDTSRVAAASGRQATRIAEARADSARRAESTRIERLALGLPVGVALVVDTLSAIRRDSLAGSLTAMGTLRGNLQRLGVDATVRGADLVARGNSARRLVATVSSANARDRAAPLAFRVDADTVQAGGYGFARIAGAGSWSNQVLSADLRVRQDSLISYAALGSYARPASGVHVVHLDSLRAGFDTLVWRLAHPGTLRLDQGAVSLDSVDLRSSAGGRLFANGVVPKSDPIRLDVAAENVRVATVLQALQRDVVADGVLAATGRIEGTRSDPAITARATLRSASYQGTRAPDADVDLRYAARRLALEAIARDSAGRRVLTGNASLPADLSLTSVDGSRRLAGQLGADVVMDSLALAALPLRSRSFADIRGVLAGDVRVRGSWQSPHFAGHVALRGGELSLVSTGMHAESANADLRLAGDTLYLDSLVARAKGEMRASGTVALADRSHPYVSVTASGRDLRVFDSIRGLVDADGEIVAAGPLDALRVTGRGEMKHGYLALKQFRKDLLRVKTPGSLDFFTVYDTSAAPEDSLRVRAERASKRRFAMIADLSLVVDRGNYYRNRPDANTEFFTGEGEEVRVKIDQRHGDQWAVGFVRIGGGIALFRARAFTPARGTLTFGSHTDAPAMVQQVGERDVWEPGRGLFPIQLLTGGTSKAPAVGIESGTLFPIRGRELNSYLTLGRGYTSLLQQSGSSLSGSEAWSGQLSGESGAMARRQQAATALGLVLHDIGTGATKEFGLDAFSVSAADVPTELVSGKSGGVRGAIFEGGQYVTVDRYLAGQFRLTSGIPGFRMSQLFGTTYRLDVGIEPRFLFRGPEELGITHPTVRTGVFGLFLTRLWDF